MTEITEEAHTKILTKLEEEEWKKKWEIPNSISSMMGGIVSLAIGSLVLSNFSPLIESDKTKEKRINYD